MDKSKKSRLFDTPYNELSDEEAHRLKQEVTLVVGNELIGVEPVAVRSVGVVGDAASYDPTLFLNPATGYEWDVPNMGALATKIINEVRGIGRVMIDITPLAKNKSGSG